MHAASCEVAQRACGTRAAVRARGSPRPLRRSGQPLLGPRGVGAGVVDGDPLHGATRRAERRLEALAVAVPQRLARRAKAARDPGHALASLLGRQRRKERGVLRTGHFGAIPEQRRDGIRAKRTGHAARAHVERPAAERLRIERAGELDFRAAVSGDEGQEQLAGATAHAQHPAAGTHDGIRREAFGPGGQIGAALEPNGPGARRHGEQLVRTPRRRTDHAQRLLTPGEGNKCQHGLRVPLGSGRVEYGQDLRGQDFVECGAPGAAAHEIASAKGILGLRMQLLRARDGEVETLGGGHAGQQLKHFRSFGIEPQRFVRLRARGAAVAGLLSGFRFGEPLVGQALEIDTLGLGPQLGDRDHAADGEQNHRDECLVALSEQDDAVERATQRASTSQLGPDRPSFEPGLQVIVEIHGVAVALLGIGPHRLVDDRFEGRRHAGRSRLVVAGEHVAAEVIEGALGAFANRPDGVLVVRRFREVPLGARFFGEELQTLDAVLIRHVRPDGGRKGRLAGNEVVQHGAQRPDIAAFVGLPTGLLGRHEHERPGDRDAASGERHRQVAVEMREAGVGLLEDRGNAKVDDEDAQAVAIDEDVAGLEIAMQHAFIDVGVMRGPAYGEHDLAYEAF